jgi:hypothetical protein
MNKSEYILKSAKALMEYKPSRAMAKWPMIRDKFLTAVIEYVEGAELFVEDVKMKEKMPVSIVEEAKKIFDVK